MNLKRQWQKTCAWCQSGGLRRRFSLLFYSVTLVSVLLIGVAGLLSAADAYRGKASELVSGYTSEVGNRVDTFQDLVRNDLEYLSTNSTLLRFLYWQELQDEQKTAHWQSLTLDLMRQFSASYHYHYKIRFVNNQGEEVFGVKRDRNTGLVSIIPVTELQQHQNKPFYLEGMKLAKGQIYASEMSPSNEHGKVELPIVPVVRFVTPVIGENGVRYGLLVLSIDAEQYFSYLREVNKLDKNRHFYLVSPDGRYLFHPETGQSFMAHSDTARTFEHDFPGLLKEFRNAGQQVTLSSHGQILSARHIHPNNHTHKNGFLLIGMVDDSVAFAELRNFIAIFVGLMLVVIVLVLFTARRFINHLMGPLLFVTQQIEYLGRGQTNDLSFDYHSDDELKKMLVSSRNLMGNMRLLTQQADVVAQGDYSERVHLLSADDLLGRALNNMTEKLALTQSQQQKNDWLKDGITQLNRAITGDLSPVQLADYAISQVSRYLSAGRGVFYRYNSDTHVLELFASYMYMERDALSNCFKLGEGSVGQVARELKPIILHDPEQQTIVTGTSAVRPRHSYTYPLLREGELLGVIELATLQALDALQQEFLQRACEVIAAFLYVTDQHEQIKKLLNQAEQATLAAQQKSAELQKANQQMAVQQRQLQEQAGTLMAANVQMEEQQQQLRQQTEELQASNAQMEEQQQQLRQQAEELQVTNAQMEEQQQQMQMQAIELARKNADLNSSRDALDLRARELELASKYKSEFLANMSHELRTPLNSIILLSKMLAMNEAQHLSDDEVKRASIVHKAGEELLRLINDILDLSKIEAGKMEVRKQQIDSGEFLNEFKDFFAATAEQKHLDFKLEDFWHANFESDRDKLSQIIRNLLSNAFKFTKQGHVTLRFERSERDDLPLKIEVMDSGVGIPLDKQQLVFEAFQQVDGSTSREYGGTGLGLTISRRYVELLGGQLTLESEPNKGSRFVLYLPNHSDHTLTDQSIALPSKPAVNEVHAPPVLHDDRTNLKTSDAVVLLIDDDLYFCEAIINLNKRLGYKTLLAHTGEEGLRIAKAYRPRAILLDLGLPDLDGSAVLHQIKSDRELRKLPVYIVSAQDKDQVKLGDEYSGYLQKPIVEQQLIDAESQAFTSAFQQARQILLLAGSGLDRAQLLKMLTPQQPDIIEVTQLDDAIDYLAGNKVQLVVVDINQHPAEETCRKLRSHHAQLPLILYSAVSLSNEQEAGLRRYTDSIIVKAGRVEQRMLENVTRFLTQMPHQISLSTHDNKPQIDKLKKHHILVVDDDPRNLFVITSALEQQGATVGNALSGQKALEYLQTHKVDLVFMDIMMPEMDGYEVIRRIRSSAALKSLPIVALTAKALKADRQKVLDAGANDYLSKPVDYEVLVNMAKIWCAHNEA